MRRPAAPSAGRARLWRRSRRRRSTDRARRRRSSRAPGKSSASGTSRPSISAKSGRTDKRGDGARHRAQGRAANVVVVDLLRARRTRWKPPARLENRAGTSASRRAASSFLESSMPVGDRCRDEDDRGDGDRTRERPAPDLVDARDPARAARQMRSRSKSKSRPAALALIARAGRARRRDRSKASTSRSRSMNAPRRCSAQASPFSAVALEASPAAPSSVQVARHPAEADRLGDAQTASSPARSTTAALSKLLGVLHVARSCGLNASISEVSTSPPWMPCARSSAENMPSGRPSRCQAACTASMRCLTRNSRATMSMTGTLPPCEFMKISLRQPARATLSPISVQARMIVSSEKVSVPGYSMCSLDLPIAWTGRIQHRQIAGVARDRPGQIALVDERIDADRQMRPVLLDRRDRQHGDDLAHVGRRRNRASPFRPRYLVGSIPPSSCQLLWRARRDGFDFDLELGPGEALHHHQRRGGRRSAHELIANLHVAAQIFGGATHRR